MVKNRAYIEKLIYDTFTALDPSGVNTDKYRSIISTMDDKQFEKFFKSFLANDNEYFMLDIVEYEHDLKMEYVENAAKVIGVPLMETVFLRHVVRGKIVATQEKALVGYMNTKRTQQTVQKKNGLSISNEKRSSLTNQVTGKDKNARDSDIEASLLVALGANNILQEMHGPRSDDPVMKRKMYQDIVTKGYTLLEDMESIPTNKVTLNTVNTMLLGMGLKSDLVSSTYILPKTSEEIFE